MAEFDPDAYLKSGAEKPFDPDAYLKGTPSSMPAEPPGEIEDAVKGAAIGLPKGFIEGVGLPGSFREGAGKAVQGLTAPFIGDTGSKIAGKATEGLASAAMPGAVIPSADKIKKTVEAATGKFYEPKTDVGRYAQTGAEAVGNPLSYVGPGGIVGKIAIALAGALGGEAASDLVKDEDWRPYAKVAGSLVSSMGASGAVGLVRALTNMARPYRTTSEFGIPTTLGKQTGDPKQIADEQAMAAGARGGLAQKIMQRSEKASGDAVEKTMDDIGEGIGGIPAAPADVGEAIQGSLRGQAAQHKAQANELYESARNKNAWVAAGEHRPTLAIDSVLENEGASLHEGLPSAIKAYERIKSLEAGKLAPDEMGLRVGRKKGEAPLINKAPSSLAETDGGVRVLSLQEMLQVRRQIRPMRGTNPEDQRALNHVKSTYDDWMQDTVNNALFVGDKSAIQDVKNANRLWYEYRQLTDPRRGSGDDVQRIISDITTKRRSGDEVANYFLNSTSVGMAGRAARVAGRLRDTLGETSDEWQALRQAAWTKLLTSAGRRATPVQVAKAIDRFVDGEGKELARTLFSPTEMQQFRQFSTTVGTLNPPKANASGSGHEIARWLMPLITAAMGVGGLEGFAHTGHARWLAMGSLPVIGNVKSAMKADIATKDVPPNLGVLGRAARGTAPAVTDAIEGNP